MNEHVKYKSAALQEALDKSAGEMLLLQLPTGEGLTKKEMKEGEKFVPYMVLGSLTALGEYFAVRSTEVAATNKKQASKFKHSAELSLLFSRVPLIPGFKMYKWSRIEDKRELQDYVSKLGKKSDDNKTKKLKMNKHTTLKIMSCAACHSNPV